jgi:peroxiredoxin Q/BCP
MSVTVGKKVPAFKAESTSGPVSLKDFKGKNLVLYFYPKDSTPGCTTEGQNFRDRYEQLLAANTELIGVSRDSIASHQRFREKMGFQFALIADTDQTLCELFDVIKPKKLYGKVHIGVERSTFVIDPAGILLREWRGLKVPGHAQEVLEYVEGLSP